VSVECIGRGNLLLRCGLHTAGAVSLGARGASAPTEAGEGRGHILAAARLQLVLLLDYQEHQPLNSFYVKEYK